MLLSLSEHADLSGATLPERHSDALVSPPLGSSLETPSSAPFLAAHYAPCTELEWGDYGLLMLHVPGYSDNHSGS